MRTFIWNSVDDNPPAKCHDVLLQFAQNMATGFWIEENEKGEKKWCVYSGNGFFTDCDDAPIAWAELPEGLKAREDPNFEPCARRGIPRADDNFDCIGYGISENDDEPCEMCKHCRSQQSYDESEDPENFFSFFDYDPDIENASESNE